MNQRMRRPVSMTTPEANRVADWHQRRERNNAAARRSRVSRRMKEVRLNDRLRQLEAENTALRVQIASLRVAVQTGNRDWHEPQ